MRDTPAVPSKQPVAGSSPARRARLPPSSGRTCGISAPPFRRPLACRVLRARWLAACTATGQPGCSLHLLLSELAQSLRDFLLPLAAAVLIDQCRAGRCVAHTVHQLAEGCSRPGNQVIARVPEIMKMQRPNPGLLDRGQPDTVAEIAMPQRHAIRPGEHQRIRNICCDRGKMLPQHRDDNFRKCNNTPARIRLGRGERQPCTAYLSQLPGHPDQVDMVLGVGAQPSLESMRRSNDPAESQGRISEPVARADHD